jgi:hypothetical protein
MGVTFDPCVFHGPLEHWNRGFKCRSGHRHMSVSFSVILSCVGSGLTMGQPPVQGVLPGYLNAFIVSEVNSELKLAKGPNP